MTNKEFMMRKIPISTKLPATSFISIGSISKRACNIRNQITCSRGSKLFIIRNLIIYKGIANAMPLFCISNKGTAKMLAEMASIYADARANVCGRYFPFSLKNLPFSLKNLPFPKKFFPIF